jgi:hypothetical protein
LFSEVVVKKLACVDWMLWKGNISYGDCVYYTNC